MLFNTKEFEKNVENRIEHTVQECLELSRKEASEAKDTIQLSGDGANGLFMEPNGSINLSTDLNTQQGAFTQINQYATTMASQVFNNINIEMPLTDPLLSRIPGKSFPTQDINFDVMAAQAGFAQKGPFASQTAPTGTTGYNHVSMRSGNFSSKVQLDLDEMMLYRDTGKIDGSYLTTAMSRAIRQVALNLYQSQRSCIFDTIIDNEFVYYDYAGNIQDVVSYGRPEENVIDFAPTATEAWNIKAVDGTITPNLDSNPIGQLTRAWADVRNTVLQITKPYLKALIMSPEDAAVLTLSAQNDGSPVNAISFMAAIRDGSFDAASVIKSNVPVLNGVDIIVYDGTKAVSIDENTGTYTPETGLERYCKPGNIIPVIEYQNSAMGFLGFTPNPVKHLFNNESMASGVLPINESAPGSSYMRTVYSKEVPTATTPSWSVEGSMQFAYVNPLAQNTFIIKTMYEEQA